MKKLCVDFKPFFCTKIDFLNSISSVSLLKYLWTCRKSLWIDLGLSQLSLRLECSMVDSEFQRKSFQPLRTLAIHLVTLQHTTLLWFLHSSDYCRECQNPTRPCLQRLRSHSPGHKPHGATACPAPVECLACSRCSVSRHWINEYKHSGIRCYVTAWEVKESVLQLQRF